MWYFTLKLVYKLILRRSYCEMNSCRYSMRHKSRSQAHKNVDYFQPYKYVFFANTSFLLSLPLFLLLEKICCKFNDRQILFHVWLRYLHWYAYYYLILNNVIVILQKLFNVTDNNISEQDLNKISLQGNVINSNEQKRET